ASNGAEAVELFKAQEHEIAVVILDMVMPGTGGSETFDILKSFDPNIKVLLSSGYSLTGEATKILDRGCCGFIQKPYEMTVLAEKIRDILGNEKKYDEREGDKFGPWLKCK
ncbi:MAG: hypothetical protein CVU52_06485, partial [Deltaproteobacteria bacterium HGW-Deltaproteobacteria-10]